MGGDQLFSYGQTCRKVVPWSSKGVKDSNNRHLNSCFKPSSQEKWRFENMETVTCSPWQSQIFKPIWHLDSFFTRSSNFLPGGVPCPNIDLKNQQQVRLRRCRCRCRRRLGRNNFRNEWESIYTTSSHFPSSIPVGRDGREQYFASNDPQQWLPWWVKWLC